MTSHCQHRWMLLLRCGGTERHKYSIREDHFISSHWRLYALIRQAPVGNCTVVADPDFGHVIGLCDLSRYSALQLMGSVISERFQQSLKLQWQNCLHQYHSGIQRAAVMQRVIL